MKTHTKFLVFTFSVLITLFSLSGCGSEGPEPIDESVYLGDYIGFHRLVDSVSLKPVLGDDIDYSFYDTLKVTSGDDPTDGLIYALSGYLNGKKIEVDLRKTANNITPVLIGTVAIGDVTLENTKVNNGSNATWNDPKTSVNIKLNASVTIKIGSVNVPVSGIRLWGDFVKD